VGNQDGLLILRTRGYEGPCTVLPLWGIAADWVDHAFPDARPSLGRGDFVVGFVGRFLQRKGLLTLIDAVALLPDSPLVILVGDGPDRSEIAAQARQRGVRLELVGPVPHADLPAYYRTMDAFVLPSLTTPGWKEQFGHVLIEAMLSGTPVIGSDSGEIPNVIGDAGLIFPEGDADALACALRSLMQDASLRCDLALRGRERVLQRYTHERIAEGTYQVYRQVLSQ
jgi:glycosyltransferase involved in cell wall biosynthesis